MAVPAEFDCLVVGAGMVGATAALMLAGAGRRVGLIEQRPAPAAGAPAADVRGLVLAPASIRILNAAGVWSRLLPLATPIRHIHISERGRFGAVRLEAVEAGLDALGWACPADLLQQELGLAAAAALGPNWYDSTRYLGHVADTAGVTVSAEQAGQPLTLRARVLIGADGADSTVRSGAGIGLTTQAYGQQAIVANVSVASPQPDTAFERFTARGPLAMIPRGGARYVSVQCLDDECAAAALALADTAYLALLTRRFSLRLGALSALGPRHAHALVRRQAKSLTAPRVVVIGNAANTVHPNAAQGLNLGLRDVQGLMLAVADAPDAGDTAILARYAASRARDQARIVGFTDLLARTFRSPLTIAALGRSAALAAVAILPPLRRALVVEASGLAALARMQHG